MREEKRKLHRKLNPYPHEEWENISVPFEADSKVKERFILHARSAEKPRIAIAEQSKVDKLRDRFFGQDFKTDNLYHIYRFLHDRICVAKISSPGRLEQTSLEKKEIRTLIPMLRKLKDESKGLSKPSSMKIKVTLDDEVYTFKSDRVIGEWKNAISSSGLFSLYTNNFTEVASRLPQQEKELAERNLEAFRKASPKVTENNMYGEAFLQVEEFLEPFCSSQRQGRVLTGRLAEIVFDSLGDKLTNSYDNSYDDEGIITWVRDKIDAHNRSKVS